MQWSLVLRAVTAGYFCCFRSALLATCQLQPPRRSGRHAMPCWPTPTKQRSQPLTSGSRVGKAPTQQAGCLNVNPCLTIETEKIPAKRLALGTWRGLQKLLSADRRGLCLADCAAAYLVGPITERMPAENKPPVRESQGQRLGRPASEGIFYAVARCCRVCCGVVCFME